jgi:hypothetical protein
MSEWQVDPDDAPLLEARKWRVARFGKYRYVCSWDRSRGRETLLHRFLLGAGPGQLVDHINHDTLDNRRCNLRICTASENVRNKRKPPTYRGLPTKNRLKGTRQTSSGRWQAQIHDGVRQRHLGCFDTEVEAHAAYCVAAAKYHGDFACAG